MKAKVFNLLGQRSSYRDFLKDYRKYYLFYIIFIFFIASFYFIQWPIVKGDTDLWYHLNGGRYILENKSLPHSSFFSFVSPPREWIDYYWLFQIILYKTYSLFDYYGLIVLRTIIYLFAIFFISLYFLRKQEDDRLQLYFTIVFTLYFLTLIPRYLLVRPHMFSYLFIVIFLYILEFKPKKTIYLPLVAILWLNLHGIEYPVLILISLSYLTEIYIRRMQSKTPFTKSELSYIIPIVITMCAIFLTPHGMKILKVPFISTEYASQYINEALPLKLQYVLSLNILDPHHPTIFNLLLIMACLITIISIFKKRIRISHLILFIGGIILLTKGIRFRYEFALLAMPILKSNILTTSRQSNKRLLNYVHIVSLLLLTVMSFMFLNQFFSNKPRYPLSHKALPQGIVTFLNRIGSGGSVLNYPTNGGYHQWMLYPRYKIFMDMEVPFLFTDEDFYIAYNVFSNEDIFRRVILKYKPSFIAVPITNEISEGILNKIPEYTAVFFDDEEVLYVNNRDNSAIAKQYKLKINPFTIIGANIDLLSKDDREVVLKELLRLVEIYPECNLMNQVIAMLYNKEENYKKAMPYIDAIINKSPELPKGYRLKGDSLTMLKSYFEAIGYYNMALKRSDSYDKTEIYKKLWVCYSNLRRYKEAYTSLNKAINIFSPSTTYVDLYNYGITALRVGKITEAYLVLKFARLKVPHANDEWKKKIIKELSKFDIEDDNLREELP